MAAVLALSSCGGGGDSDEAGDVSALALVLLSAEPEGANCPGGGRRVEAGVDSDGNGVLDPPEMRSMQYVCKASAGSDGIGNLVAVNVEAPGAHCAKGGQRITSGADSNGNGLLDSFEVSATSFACNGTGAGGALAAKGLNSLVALVSEPAGANCSHGGRKLSAGADSNANGVLDPAEVSTTSYVCNGSNASNAAAGSNGLDSLVKIATEPPGVHCAAGGNRVSSGVDSNANGILDSAEVSATSHVCNGTNGAPGSNGANGLTTLAAIATEPAGASCPAGGNKISFGADSNANGILDSAEVSATNYVCNGANGANGSNGANGLTTLVASASEPAGANCPNGGRAITSGPDSNANGVLNAAEVTSTSYVCNGSNGTNGSNGRNSLLASAVEPAGANCTHGGQKLTAGLDSNNNAALDPAEVTTTTYTCNGAPGPGITWVDATAASVQTVSNTGYLANNAAQVSFTLPANPAIGDVIQISGAGAGGWKIAQNAGQFIGTRNVRLDRVWTARTVDRNWQSIASSADGSRLVAVVNGDKIHTSTDAGVNWTERTSVARAWWSVASSADGSRLVAAVLNGKIYTSTNSGASWTDRASSEGWMSVASSSDGTRLAAVAYAGQIWTSTDSGVTWTQRDSVRNWRAVASSTDGTRLVAVVENGQIYTSSDSGANWTARDSSRNWRAVASSSDGTRLVAAVYGGQIYTSRDSGVTWTPRETTRNWSTVSSSADGSRLVAGVFEGQVYTSNDSGATWHAHDTSRNWRSVASSADGSRVAAAVYGSRIYTSLSSPRASTTLGTGGSIAGLQSDAIELQYVGNGEFIVRHARGAFDVR